MKKIFRKKICSYFVEMINVPKVIKNFKYNK